MLRLKGARNYNNLYLLLNVAWVPGTVQSYLHTLSFNLHSKSMRPSWQPFFKRGSLGEVVLQPVGKWRVRMRTCLSNSKLLWTMLCHPGGCTRYQLCPAGWVEGTGRCPRRHQPTPQTGRVLSQGPHQHRQRNSEKVLTTPWSGQRRPLRGVEVWARP